MCRLYGYFSEQPTRVECGLVCAQNSLMNQSEHDKRGLPNPDGWGVAYFSNGVPHVKKRVLSAARDEQYRVTADEIYTRSLVAHVRSATVGGVRIENVHPFFVGRWVFAHNGTVPGFDAIEHRFAEDTPGWLLAERRGSTDSEMCFVWLLGRLERAHPGATLLGAPSSVVAAVLRHGVRQILSWCGETRPDINPSLNFVLTDGQMLLAARCGRTLYSLEREDLHACELCGSCHCPVCSVRDEHSHGDRVSCRAIVVASEPITTERWREIDEGVVLCVDDRLQLDHATI